MIDICTVQCRFLDGLRNVRKKHANSKTPIDDVENEDHEEQQREEEKESENKIPDSTKLVYFTCNTPNNDIIDSLQTLSTNVKVS